MKKTYLGDGVYVDWNGYEVTMTTEDGYKATNTIVLEPEVLKALELYLARLKEKIVKDSDLPF